jgi:hypothetical protein
VRGLLKKPDVVYVQDVKPPENSVIVPIDESNIQDLIDRANAKLVHSGSYDPKTEIYTGFVTDTYKALKFYDKISPVQKKWSLGISAGIGLFDRRASPLFGIYGIHHFNVIDIGGHISAYKTNASAELFAGISF